MQIHELNNFNGELDAGAYLAVDNGSDTGKVSSEQLVGPTKRELSRVESELNTRIDNIIAGGTAPSAAEVTDARQGASGLVYPSLGDAIRNQTGIYETYNSIVFTSNYVQEPCYIPDQGKVIVRTLDGSNFSGGAITFFDRSGSEINQWSLSASMNVREVYPNGGDCYYVYIGGESDPTNIQLCRVFQYEDIRSVVNNLGTISVRSSGGVVPEYSISTGKLNLKTGVLFIGIPGNPIALNHETIINQLGSSIASEDGSGNLIITIGSEYALVYDTWSSTLKRIVSSNYAPDHQIPIIVANYSNGYSGLLALTMSSFINESIDLLSRITKQNYAYLSDGGTISGYDPATGSINIGTSNINIMMNGSIVSFNHATIISHLGAAKASEDASGNLTIKIGAASALVYNYQTEKLATVEIRNVNKQNHIFLFGTYYLAGSAGLLAETDCYKKVRDNEKVTVTRVFNSSPAYADENLQTVLANYGKAVMNAGVHSERFLFFSDPHCLSGDINETNLVGMISTIQKFYNSSPADFVLSGGDWIGNSDTLDTAAYKLGLVKGLGKSMLGGKEFYNIVGNHDLNYQGTPTLTEDQMRNIWYSGNKCYFEIKRESCTFYALDTGVENDDTLNAYRLEQLGWLCGKLVADDADHNAIFLHIVFTDANDPTQISAMATKVGEIITAYNGQSTITIDEMTYDFSGCNGSVDFVLCGHIHKDLDTTLGGVPCVSVINTGAAGTGTATFDLCVADFDNGKLKMIRVGSGSDREFNI